MRPSTTRKRKGAALVEFAMVFPLFILLAVAAIDVGRAIMVKHKLVEAARAGCRLYILKDEPSEEDVTDIVDRVMAGSNLQGHTVTMDPNSSNDIERLQPVTVSVSIPYAEVSWLRGSGFLSNSTLTGACIMPGDSGNSN
jgi:Flp pilus assembly protein TadG